LFLLKNLFELKLLSNKYAGDLNETYFVGKTDEASQQLLRCTYECLEKAISIGNCHLVYNFGVLVLGFPIATLFSALLQWSC